MYSKDKKSVVKVCYDSVKLRLIGFGKYWSPDLSRVGSFYMQEFFDHFDDIWHASCKKRMRGSKDFIKIPLIVGFFLGT